MARLVAPAAPPLARFAPKNFQNWSGVIAFGPVPMKTALNLSLKEKLTFVQLTCLALVGRLPASLVGKREALIEKKGAKASGAACGKAEREKEGRSNGGAHVDLSREKSRWQLWLAFLGVVAVLASATVALPPSHPVLLHTLFWPSLALSLSYPVTRISNPEGERLVTKSKGNESHPAASLLCKLCRSRLRSLPPRPVLLLVLLPPAQSSPCSTTPWRRR